MPSIPAGVLIIYKLAVFDVMLYACGMSWATHDPTLG